MDSTGFLLGILPLIVFAVVEGMGNRRLALICAGFLAIAEAGLTYWYFGELDWITGVSVFLILAFAIVSYQTGSGLFFKAQPVVLSIIVGAIFIGTYHYGNPILLEMMDKYQVALPSNAQDLLRISQVRHFLSLATLTCGWSLIAHAVLVALLAWKSSTWVWLIGRVLGFYVFLFLGMLAARLIIIDI